MVFGVMTVDGADNAGGVLGRRNIEGKGELQMLQRSQNNSGQSAEILNQRNREKATAANLRNIIGGYVITYVTCK